MKLNKLKEIYQGWKNYLFNKEEVKTLSDKRKIACNSCPLNKNNVCTKHDGDIAIVDFNYRGESRFKGKMYKGCGCPLKAKQSSPNSQCPTGRWENL